MRPPPDKDLWYLRRASNFSRCAETKMSPQPPTRPSSAFVSSLVDGDSRSVRGVLAEDEFQLQVVQQPPGQAGYVDDAVGTVTQFAMAAQFGIVGLLAHDWLSGAYFEGLRPGKRVDLIYGDGHSVSYRVTRVFHYQATDPTSMTSSFIDLDTNASLSADQLFNRVYRGPEHVTLQTCITRDGNPSWGRLFVVAVPETPISVVIPGADVRKRRKKRDEG